MTVIYLLQGRGSKGTCCIDIEEDARDCPACQPHVRSLHAVLHYVHKIICLEVQLSIQVLNYLPLPEVLAIAWASCHTS